MATNAQKRVAIAKDVLKQLNDDNICPITGRYTMYGRFYSNELLNCKTSQDVQKLLVEKKADRNSCRACALGACMISYARLYNSLSADQVVASNPYNIKQLANLFGKRRMMRIETAFDYHADDYTAPGTGLNDTDMVLTRKEYNKSVAWRDRYPDDKERLKAIMKNIIRNKGEFG